MKSFSLDQIASNLVPIVPLVEKSGKYQKGFKNKRRDLFLQMNSVFFVENWFAVREKALAPQTAGFRL